MCVFHVHSPWRLHLSGTVGMWGNRSMMLCWRRFYPLPSPFIATLAPSLATLSCSHTRSRQSHEPTRVRLACQKLNSIPNFAMVGKKSELSVIKWLRNQMINVVATLWQRSGNVLTTSDSNVVTTSETDVATTLIFNHATTLWQRQPRRCDNVVTTSLCQLGDLKTWLQRLHY